jgi:hypothetical protein
MVNRCASDSLDGTAVKGLARGASQGRKLKGGHGERVPAEVGFVVIRVTSTGYLLDPNAYLDWLGEASDALIPAQGVSAASGCKWVRRWRTEGQAGLADRSSRPASSLDGSAMTGNGRSWFAASRGRPRVGRGAWGLRGLCVITPVVCAVAS